MKKKIVVLAVTLTALCAGTVFADEKGDDKGKCDKRDHMKEMVENAPEKTIIGEINFSKDDKKMATIVVDETLYKIIMPKDVYKKLEIEAKSNISVKGKVLDSKWYGDETKTMLVQKVIYNEVEEDVKMERKHRKDKKDDRKKDKKDDDDKKCKCCK